MLAMARDWFQWTDDVIEGLLPTQDDVEDREHVEQWIHHILNSSFGCKSFACGASLSKVLLPWEPVDICQIVPKNQNTNWSARCNEIFSQESLKPNQDIRQELMNEPIVESISLFPRSSCLLLTIDGLTFRVYSNDAKSLLLSALTEEVSNMVGRNNLFKKTLLLVKAWTYWETRKMTTLDINKLLPHDALVVILLWIFSKYSQENIEHPLQGLKLYLKEMSELNWADFSIALASYNTDPVPVLGPFDDEGYARGPRGSLDGDLSGITTPSALQPQGLGEDFGSDSGFEDNLAMPFRRVVDKYQKLYERNFSRNSNSKPSSEKKVAAHSTFSAGDMYRTGGPTSVAQIGSFMARSQSKMEIVDPITGSENLLCLNALRPSYAQAVLKEIFRGGINEFHRAMCQEPYAFSRSNSVEGSEFMALTWATVLKRKVSSPVHFDFTASVNEIADLIRHAERTLNTKISAEAIVNLVVQILSQYGPLPIGEIGKHLQNATGITNLPKVLKKSFCGLKSLTASYPHIFQIGDDHEFNPHIYLVPKQTTGIHTASPSSSNSSRLDSSQRTYAESYSANTSSSSLVDMKYISKQSQPSPRTASNDRLADPYGAPLMQQYDFNKGPTPPISQRLSLSSSNGHSSAFPTARNSGFSGDREDGFLNATSRMVYNNYRSSGAPQYASARGPESSQFMRSSDATSSGMLNLDRSQSLSQYTGHTIRAPARNAVYPNNFSQPNSMDRNHDFLHSFPPSSSSTHPNQEREDIDGNMNSRYGPSNDGHYRTF